MYIMEYKITSIETYNKSYSGLLANYRRNNLI